MITLLNWITERALAQNQGVNLLQPIGNSQGGGSAVSSVAKYLSVAFPVFLGAAIALAVVMVTWGGLEYILSEVPGAKVEGKERIRHAIWGLLLALTAWIILNTINPNINLPGIFENL